MFQQETQLILDTGGRYSTIKNFAHHPQRCENECRAPPSAAAPSEKGGLAVLPPAGGAAHAHAENGMMRIPEAAAPARHADDCPTTKSSADEGARCDVNAGPVRRGDREDHPRAIRREDGRMPRHPRTRLRVHGSRRTAASCTTDRRFPTTDRTKPPAPRRARRRIRIACRCRRLRSCAQPRPVTGPQRLAA